MHFANSSLAQEHPTLLWLRVLICGSIELILFLNFRIPLCRTLSTWEVFNASHQSLFPKIWRTLCRALVIMVSSSCLWALSLVSFLMMWLRRLLKLLQNFHRRSSGGTKERDPLLWETTPLWWTGCLRMIYWVILRPEHLWHMEEPMGFKKPFTTGYQSLDLGRFLTSLIILQKWEYEG